MDAQELHNITTVINALVGIKWALICIAIGQLVGIVGPYLFSKGIEAYKKQDPKNNLHNLPDEGCEGGHY